MSIIMLNYVKKTWTNNSVNLICVTIYNLLYYTTYFATHTNMTYIDI